MQLLIFRDFRLGRGVRRLVKELVNGVGRLLAETFRLHQLLRRETPNFIHGAEGLEQRGAPFGADSRNLVKQGLNLAVPAQFFVVGDGEAVGFVLDSSDEMERVGMGVDSELSVLIEQCPRSMPVVLDHAGDGNVQVKFIQNGKRRVYLTASAVHEDQVRQLSEPSQGEIHVFFIQLPDL